MKAAYLDYASLDQQDLDFQALQQYLISWSYTRPHRLQRFSLVWLMSMSSLPTKL